MITYSDMFLGLLAMAVDRSDDTSQHTASECAELIRQRLTIGLPPSLLHVAINVRSGVDPHRWVPGRKLSVRGAVARQV